MATERTADVILGAFQDEMTARRKYDLKDSKGKVTATLYFRSSAHGTNTVDIVSNTTNPETYFSGYLVC